MTLIFVFIHLQICPTPIEQFTQPDHFTPGKISALKIILAQLASTTAPRLTATAFISQLLMTQIWGSTSSPRLAAVQSIDPAWPAASPAACYRTPTSSNTLLLPAMQGQFSLRRSLLSWLKNFSGFHSLIDFHFSTFAGSVSFGSGTLFSFVSDPTAHLAASV